MGWYYTQHPGTKASYIAELLEPRTNSRTGDITRPIHIMKPIRHCWRGGRFSGVLWSIWECTALEPHRARWIQCDVMECKGGCWGHKPMEEAMHPYFYSCPLGYLAMVPEVQSAEWRAFVVAYHAERAAKRAAKRAELVALAQARSAVLAYVPGCPVCELEGSRPCRH